MCVVLSYSWWIVLLFVQVLSRRKNNCVPLPECQPAVDMLLSKPLDPFTLKMLQISQCGRTEEYIKVRCEEIEIPCKTPSNRNGTCVPIKSCPPYVSILKMFNVKDPLTKKYLREFRCDSPEGHIHICCPEVKFEVNDRSFVPQPELEQCGVHVSDDRIVGGTVAGIDEFPWMALLEYRSTNNRLEPACGGSLINSRYVVTAAHCVDTVFLQTVGYKRLENVILGEYDTRNETDCVEFETGRQCAPPARKFKVDVYIVHPGWRRNLDDDIALIRLDEQVQFNEYIRPICLPLAGINLTTDERFLVAGWGRTEKERRSPLKIKASVPLANRSQCLGKLSDNQLCAGNIRGSDTCVGDSGGPLMLEHNVNSNYLVFLIGVVSYGPGVCGSRPAVYTYVPNYVKWITEILDLERSFIW